MLFCGDGVGKKFVEEKFPHLTYSDKECDDSKRRNCVLWRMRIQQEVFSHMRSLLRWKMKMQVSGNNMLPDTDQLAFVDEAEKTVSWQSSRSSRT